MWDPRVVCVSDNLIGDFSVSIEIEGCDQSKWWFSAIYRPVQSRQRELFWDELVGLESICGDKWCLGGDFNVVRNTGEKLNSFTNTTSMQCFDELIGELRLHDPPLLNAKYTWSNFRANPICCRLDRYLFSRDWMDIFPNYRQVVLPRITSDHCPVVLDTAELRWGPAPFRFENTWLSHQNFKQLVRSWWNSGVTRGWDYKFMMKLKRMKVEVSKWNREVFGDVGVRYTKVVTRIKQLDDLEAEGSWSEILQEERTKEQIDYICLIPKKQDATKSKDFRPISLTTSLYKILAKVLENRLKNILGKTIAENQSAFIKGRQILDCCLIANEIVEDHRRNKKRGWVFKVDLEKDFGLDRGRGSMGVSRILPFRYSSMVDLEESFRGREDYVKGILYHLFSLTLSLMGWDEEVDSLASQIGCKRDNWPIKYLGAPLGGDPKSAEFWEPVLSKMSKKLASWKKSFLSRGGRLMLIKSVLSAMPTYYMSLFRVPARVEKKMEKMKRDFLWDGADGENHCHVVGWNHVCKPKERGGLGLGNIRFTNKALLGKWWWRCSVEKEALWRKVIKSIYGLQDNDVTDSRSSNNFQWDVRFRRNLNEAEIDELSDLLGVLDTIRLERGSDDYRVWLGDSSGCFSVRSFYNSFFPVTDFSLFPYHNNIWKIPVPHKVQVFSWIVALGKLPTCDTVQKRWPSCTLRPQWYSLCRNSEENQDHLMLHCSFSRAIWTRVMGELSFEWVFPHHARDLFLIETVLPNGRRNKWFWFLVVHGIFWAI
ncbi:uncharacterized protein [Primulina eburnea]|uniref:uncharacterized protein n=1 Tax=Primulina eburnea TaxID=1245227 RepID=UPI003C6CA90B